MNLLERTSFILRAILLGALALVLFVLLVSKALKVERTQQAESSDPADVATVQCRAQCDRELPPEVLVGGGLRDGECVCLIRIGRAESR